MSNDIHVDYSWADKPKEHWGYSVTFRSKRKAQRFIRALQKLMQDHAEDLPAVGPRRSV
jgi:hypothetical protein